MKYGVNTLAWTTRVDERLAPLAGKIKRWGFDGVELFLSPGEPANITAVNRMLDAEGFERTTCSVLPREANLVSRDAQVRARGVEFLKKCVDRTAELGWIEYYGRYAPSALYPLLRYVNQTLIAWAMRKFKRFKDHSVRASQFLQRLATERRALFVHWDIDMPGVFA